MKKRRSGVYLKTIIYLCLIALTAAAQWAGVFQEADSRLGDKIYQKGRLRSPDIYVIGIDEESLMELGPFAQWDRSVFARMLERLNGNEDSRPAVIGLDIGFYGNRDAAGDARLAEAAEEGGNVVLASYGSFGQSIVETDTGFYVREAVMTLEEPYEPLNRAAASGHTNVSLDPDGIVRRSLHCFQTEGRTVYSFAAELYRLYTGSLPVMPEGMEESWYIPFAGAPYEYYGSSTSGLSFSRVLTGEIPPEMFAGSIVLIGPYSSGMMDSYYTPMDHRTPMYGVEIHANILQALLDGQMKQEVPMLYSVLITVFLGLAAWLLSGLKDIRKYSLCICLLAAACWMGALKAYSAGYAASLFYPLLMLGVLWLFHIGAGYLEEYAGRRSMFSMLERYVSKDVAHSLMKEEPEVLGLGGQKREIAVLFVDIRGFTTMSEALEPEQVVAVLNRYLSLTTRAVFANGGTVDKFIGDATMAIYNAPASLDQYVLKAVLTGLYMTEHARDLSREITELTGRSLGFGIGIHCGPAVVGNIGTDTRMDYTAIGDTVNVAARLESQAGPGEILISGQVYEQVKDRVECVCLGNRSLKGKESQIPVYRVLGLKGVEV